MKIPLSPPPIERFYELIESGDMEKIKLVFSSSIGTCDTKGRYVHWDKLRHLQPPEGFDSELYWFAMRQARNHISRDLPFKDKLNQPFSYCIPDSVMKDIIWISENATGAIAAQAGLSDIRTKQTYLINSLIEEAINSSQLEGASTTSKVAKEMIRTGRAPKNISEKMIKNNYNAMKFIREFKNEILTPSMIFELHKILVNDTLAEDDIGKEGVFRTSTDEIGVYSHDNVLLHTPPNASGLKQRLQLICDFANKIGEDESLYVPPTLRAIIVHFMIGYDHPFIDGNGRTARALFYWIMAREGFWLMEYISISRVLKKAPSQYMNAYLHTETDSNDVTYFIVHQLKAIKEAIGDLHKYLDMKTKQIIAAENILEHSLLQGQLNLRQLGIIRHALKNPGAEYTIKSHQTSHGISYQTARTDMLGLSDKYKILKKYRSHKADIFIAPANLKELIKNIK